MIGINICIDLKHTKKTDSRRLHPSDIQLLILEGVYLYVPLEVALDVSLSSAQACVQLFGLQAGQ